MDSNLKDRLESINSRIVRNTKKANKESVKQKVKLYQLENNVEHAYNAWSNSSLNQDEALKAYQSLFPSGKCIELGPVQLKGNKSITAFSFTHNNGAGGKPYFRHNDSTMSYNAGNNSHYLGKMPFQNKTTSNKRLRELDSMDTTMVGQRKARDEVNMSKSESIMKNVNTPRDGDNGVAQPQYQAGQTGRTEGNKDSGEIMGD
jgi:hypothetical protein